MRPRELPTIQCPGCGRSLPADILRCHFCGDDLAFVGRPEKPPEGPLPGTIDHRMEKLYRGVAYYWIVDGCCTILVGLQILPSWASGIGGMLFSYLGLEVTTGFLIAILGIGMLTKVHMARWLVGGFCWFRVVIGLTGIGILFRVSGDILATKNFVVPFILNVVDTLFSGFQIYLLNVTDDEVPN